MRILVVGSGGREHALAWKLSQEAEVFAAPGNPGIAEVATLLPFSPADGDSIAAECARLSIDLAVVGPESPLIAGLADQLRAHGVTVFGPSMAAAQLEGSKAFAKEVMREAGIPTAGFRVFTDPDEAEDSAREAYASGRQLVVKASGPALGKGAIMTSTLDEAIEAIERCMVDDAFGEAGRTVVLEERMVGEEFSLLTLCSGGHYVSLPVAQDYKRALDGDRGPNTGGMGSFSPVDWVTPNLVARTEEYVVAPVLRLMQERGTPFQGCLFSGLMLVDGMPRCIEYNVRFGDPETQSVMMRLGGGLASALLAAAKAEPIPPIQVKANAAVAVVVASSGYPGPIETGLPVTLREPDSGVQVFHAGTKSVDGQLVTSGGRVAAVTAAASSLSEARQLAYQNLRCIEFEGARWRADIAQSGPSS
ncbi:MAG: phosphoribosylamine--glycine ligase [Armatimonadetes bacterium]|nr:phosphoribosylamine--glycine ligase [Armatimonadota bacterium]